MMRPFFITLIVLLAILLLQPRYAAPLPEQIIPGWHTTVFPAFYWPGYVLSASALLMLGWVLVWWFSGRKTGMLSEGADVLGQVMLAAGLVAGLHWSCELFHAWYSGLMFEQFAMYNRIYGTGWFLFFPVLTAQLIVPHLFWWKSCRRSVRVSFFVALVVSISRIWEMFFVFFTPLWR